MTESKLLRIATRQSQLALWQSNFIKQQIQLIQPDVIVELVPMVTEGDRFLDTPLTKIGGKGLFVKELESALLKNEADIAVHSMKDMPMELPEGLEIAVVCERDDPRDAFVSLTCEKTSDLIKHARIGTSSLRRSCQLRARFPEMNYLDLRGNVNTRLKKLDDGLYDAIILAAVGLKRLGLSERISEYMSTDVSLPAAGQGVIAVECREEILKTFPALQQLEHVETRACIEAERAVTRTLGASCQVPVGAYAELDGHDLLLKALVADPDSSTILRSELRGQAQDAISLGEYVANDLLSKGANEILENIV